MIVHIATWQAAPLVSLLSSEALHSDFLATSFYTRTLQLVWRIRASFNPPPNHGYFPDLDVQQL